MTFNRLFSSLTLFLLLCSPITAAAQEKTPAEGDAGISVAGVPVGSGTPEEVRAYLEKALAPKLDSTITLSDGVNTVTRTRADLGIRLDLDRMMRGVRANQKYVPLLLTTDKANLKQALEQVAETFEQPAVNAKPYMYQGKLRIAPEKYQRNLNIPTTAERLTQQVEKDAATRSFRVSLTKTPPERTAEKLKGITGRLSSFATTAARNRPRDNNIRIAVQAIDGTLLSPGETFSLNQVVGRRTKARGYKEATVFVDAEPVPGVGGGVSQVTGTLFNAAALAGMKIEEVHPHSRPVPYLALGRDATVAYGAKDLKFTNNTDAPVYIGYTFRNQRLRATLYGKKVEGRTVTLQRRVQRRGPGRINAQLHRTIKDKGKLVTKQRLFSHGYRWEPD